MQSEIIKTWEQDGFKVHLFDAGFDRGRNRPELGYAFYDAESGNEPVFHGREFYPSPLHAIDSMDSVMALLAFLSLQPGDTDSEYFDKYTSDQLAWAESSRCEDLSLIVFDYEDSREDHTDSV